MFYSIRHLTKFLYSKPVSESMMETRMHPRSDQSQRCLTFHLSVSPRCRVFSFRDHLGNQVHHFDIPGQHGQLVIVAESLVEVQPAIFPPTSLPPGAWEELDTLVHEGDYWEMLFPSEFTQPTALLEELAAKLDVRRRDDPLTVMHQLNRQIYEYFEYVPSATRVDSPIDLALGKKMGVCQDFAHIMIALVRLKLRIPCRYVSGYLYHGDRDKDRSVSSATHAWVEALMPGLGWVGFDPDELAAGGRPAYPDGDRAGLCGCSADARDVSRQGGEHADGGGAGDPERGDVFARPGPPGAGRLVDAGGEGDGAAGGAGAVDAAADVGSAAATAAAVRQIGG